MKMNASLVLTDAERQHLLAQDREQKRRTEFWARKHKTSRFWEKIKHRVDHLRQYNEDKGLHTVTFETYYGNMCYEYNS
jgi:hypothetical protein